MDERASATQQAYDHAAADFAERTASRSAMAAEFFNEFVERLAPESRVGDLGSGPGHDVRRLSAAGHRPIGFDRSPQLLALSPSNAGRVRSDLRALPMRNGSLDAIWCSAALLHVDRVDIDATFTEWNRALVADGVVAFATSLGSGRDGDSESQAGWELVPAGPNRRPEIAEGHQRWFVHHDPAFLEAAVGRAGWRIAQSTVRQSHRDWLQLIAVKRR